jgi:hypothetical protein
MPESATQAAGEQVLGKGLLSANDVTLTRAQHNRQVA